jgi:hypothetical protein
MGVEVGKVSTFHDLFRQVFHFLDEDKDGCLTLNDLASLARLQGNHHPRPTALAIINECSNKFQVDRINCAEFVDGIYQKQPIICSMLSPLLGELAMQQWLQYGTLDLVLAHEYLSSLYPEPPTAKEPSSIVNTTPKRGTGGIGCNDAFLATARMLAMNISEQTALTGLARIAAVGEAIPLASLPSTSKRGAIFSAPIFKRKQSSLGHILNICRPISDNPGLEMRKGSSTSYCVDSFEKRTTSPAENLNSGSEQTNYGLVNRIRSLFSENSLEG